MQRAVRRISTPQYRNADANRSIAAWASRQIVASAATPLGRERPVLVKQPLQTRNDGGILNGKIGFFASIPRKVVQLDRFALHSLGIGCDKLPIPLDHPTIHQTVLRIVHRDDVVLKDLAENELPRLDGLRIQQIDSRQRLGCELPMAERTVGTRSILLARC